MVCEHITDLTDVNANCPIVIQEGESMNIEGALVDGDNAAISKSSLTTFTLTLYDEVTNSVINSRDDQDIKDTNGGIVNTDGTFVIRLEPADAIIKDGSTLAGRNESHIARIKWTWNDGVAARTGIQEMRIRIAKMGRP